MDDPEVLPELLTSTNLEAGVTIAQLRAHRLHSFADFLTSNWPPMVSEECDAAESVPYEDCISLKLSEEKYCECCQTYARICRAWYALPDVQQRMSA